MFGWVTAHFADLHGYTILHAHDAQLRNGILLEELLHELLRVSESEKVSGRTQVLLRHGKGEVEDEYHMPYDTSL